MSLKWLSLPVKKGKTFRHSFDICVNRWYCKGLSINEVRSQGGGLPMRTCCGQGQGVFWCGGLHFLKQKTSDFSKFMVCPHRQGWREIDHCGQGKGVNFLWLRANVFYGPPPIWQNKLFLKKPKKLPLLITH